MRKETVICDRCKKETDLAQTFVTHHPGYEEEGIFCKETFDICPSCCKKVYAAIIEVISYEEKDRSPE
jgi:hypothetical protein